MDVPEVERVHNLVAKRFKEYEQSVGRLPPVEVLNELRYALRATVELLALGCDDENDADRRRELMARVQHALLCAYHDLVDGLVIEIPKMLEELRLRFPLSSKEVAGQRLIEIVGHVKQAESEIAGARGSPAERPNVYEKLYENWFKALLDDYAFLRVAQFEIATHHEESRKTWWRRQWIQALVGLPGAFLIGWLASNVWPFDL